MNNDNIITVIILIVMITFIEALAQFCIKSSHLHSHSRSYLYYLLFGMISYTMVCLLLYLVYKYDNLSHVNLIWSCMSIILAYIVGYYYFSEPVTEYSIVSILFAFMAIYFCFLSKNV